ncbi:uncharacterized protein LOC120732093 isoform X5 [Simochromis diagramma]|uniref:uncharacterized protein LOC120732093 isoform X5 n=1 Tax=Simochromis diagramma TaxID=43689 RepID=UPI001A7E35D8|nr:uncharacterized protein LOC120732093 isoform X5 [Simochromis diagramma]
MSGSGPFFLCIYSLGYILCSSSAWQVKMPRNIKGLLGSCLVIPCSYDYYQYPPRRPDRVVWYQYVSRGYPIVYDNWNWNDVLDIFKGRTRVYTSSHHRTCSLLIDPVTLADHSQKLYPWVDPENVGWRTYPFYDTTVTVEVVGTADPPVIEIFGNTVVGQSVTVQCSVYHTCPTYPPSLRLNIPLRNERLTHSRLSNGRSKTMVTTTLFIEKEYQIVECYVEHRGGRSASASKTLTSYCSISGLTVSSASYEFLERDQSTVTCTVSYTCYRNIPTLTWNYGNMPASSDTSKLSGGAQWRTVSTLTFTASANDNGRSLICYARFAGGQTRRATITLRVKRNILNLGWSFTAPATITGLKGSCLTIPCKFSYKNSQPKDLQVIWYLYQRNEYPAVYNQEGTVIRKFNGRTSLTGSVTEKNCSLKIERLEMSDNHNQLYPWIDKNTITSYHTKGHSFYDGSTELIVSEHAPEPELNIIGTPRVGEQGTVSCSVRHACIFAPPTITLNGIPGKDRITDTLVSDGIWERRVEQVWEVKEEHQSVACTVSYSGGQKATKEIPLNVECPFQEITMNEPPGELTEGMAKNVTCSVIFKCRKNTPSVIWNYNNMQSSLNTKQTPNNTYTIVSNLTFIPSLSDDGKLLTCTAQFISGEFSTSATLTVKQYERDPFENYTTSALPADVPLRFSALTRSCVVIPCSFQYKEDEPMTRGIWSKKSGDIVFHNGQSYVIDHFKGRTKMLGNLNEGNCSLEIDDIKPFDNGPFCFYAEKGHETHTFNNSCVFIIMKASPEKPVMTPVPKEVDAGSTITVSCSVTHTCSSHPPVFSWSVSHLTIEVSEIMMSRGTWQTTSTITFIVTEGDGVRNLTCNAIFWRNREQAHTVSLNVKGSLMYQFKCSAPMAFPVSFVALIIITLAAVFAVFIWRKRKHTDESLKPPPRPEKRRSLWDRLSRRYTDDRDRPPRPEKRRSIWSRFSRKEEDRMAWQHERKPRQSFWSRFSRRQDCTANISVAYTKNSSNVTCGALSKPRCPSPKDNRRRPSPFNPENQLYGNL